MKRAPRCRIFRDPARAESSETGRADCSPVDMKSLDLNLLLGSASELAASDLHLMVGSPPAYRINGEVILAEEDAVTPEAARAAAMELLNDEQKRKFEEEWELCVSMLHPKAGRVRVTFYRRNGIPEMSFRFCGDLLGFHFARCMRRTRQPHYGTVFLRMVRGRTQQLC